MKLLIYSVFIFLHINFAYSYICQAPFSDFVCPDSSEIKYYLFTVNNNNYIQVYPGKLADVTINKGCPFVFITHGFTDNGLNFWLLDMVAELFKRTTCLNVITIDWSSITTATNYFDLNQDTNLVYPYTAYRTCCSGENVGAFFVDLYKTLGVSFTDMHCIGHSLGSHLCGCAGKYVTNQTELQIARISAMDPAGPCFNNVTTNCRLSPDDATFVDCTHTDILKFGYADTLGHADYYPNGGMNQPGCDITNITCNHGYSILLYNATITVDGFLSNVCSSYTNYENGMCTDTAQSELGYDALNTVTGKLYLDTLADPQYAMNGTRTHTSTPIIG